MSFPRDYHNQLNPVEQVSSPARSLQPALIIAGFLALLVSAYLDNVRGPLLPAISREIGLTVVQSGQFLAVGQGCGILATCVLAFGVGRWSDFRIALVGCALAVLSACLAATSGSVASLYLMSATIAAAYNVLGVVCNQFVAEGGTPATHGRLFAGLHMMFGWGAMSAAAAVQLALGTGRSWFEPVFWAVPVALGLAVFIALLVWRQHRLAAKDERGVEPKLAAESAAVPSARAMRVAFRSRHALILALCAAYVGGEVTLSAWLSTYLVNVRHLAEGDAAQRVAAFFLVMTVTRGLCFVFVRPAIEASLAALGLLLALGFFCAGISDPSGWAFAGAGVMGAFFPLLLARLHRFFPTEARSLVVWIILTMQLLLAIVNLTIGHIAAAIGLERAFLMPAFFLFLAVTLLHFYFRYESRVIMRGF